MGKEINERTTVPLGWIVATLIVVVPLMITVTVYVVKIETSVSEMAKVLPDHEARIRENEREVRKLAAKSP